MFSWHFLFGFSYISKRTEWKSERRVSKRPSTIHTHVARGDEPDYRNFSLVNSLLVKQFSCSFPFACVASTFSSLPMVLLVFCSCTFWTKQKERMSRRASDEFMSKKETMKTRLNWSLQKCQQLNEPKKFI